MKGPCSMAVAHPGINLLGLVVLLLLAMTLPQVVLARAGLVAADPAQGSTAPSGLSTITLTFSEPVSVDLTSARLSASATGKQSTVTSQVDPADHRRLGIKTAPLPDGGYTVSWHAVSERDNTTSDGQVSFSVGAASAQAAITPPRASVLNSNAPGSNPNDEEQNEEDPSGPWITLLVALVVILAAALVVQTLWFRRRGRLH